MKQSVTIHKKNTKLQSPVSSLILLDWSCRESFHALDWLNEQDIDREKYEIIWVELFDRVVEKAMDKADCLITCSQKGLYHKHMGYNFGLLNARGKIITVCDSDAVFPPNFITSIGQSFNIQETKVEPKSQVLMHYQWRSSASYPKDLKDFSRLQKYPWASLWPNVGACMSVLKTDALRFGGFDEHRSLKGYLCGPYDLGWRLVNAGIPEVWHDKNTALWHFSHPDPPATYGQVFSIKMWREITYPHVDHHALTAVDAFSSGRILPLEENPEIHRIRMKNRIIGTRFEEKYAWMAGQKGFGKVQLLKYHLFLVLQTLKKLLWAILKIIERRMGAERYAKVKRFILRRPELD